MQDRGSGDLDIVGEVRTKIKAVVSLFRRGPGITGEQHHIGDVLWITDNLTDEVRGALAACLTRCLSHFVPPQKFRFGNLECPAACFVDLGQTIWLIKLSRLAERARRVGASMIAPVTPASELGVIVTE